MALSLPWPIWEGYNDAERASAKGTSPLLSRSSSLSKRLSLTMWILEHATLLQPPAA